MAHWSRRNFLKTGLAAGVLAGSGSLPLRSARRSATDWVTLGKSGVNVTRLAFGTGTLSGQTQRELGQDQFTRLVRHAYDQGIRFFETFRPRSRLYQAHPAQHPECLAHAVSSPGEAPAVTVSG